MSLITGFQKSVDLNVYNAYPGDLASDKTAVTLAGNGYIALGDVTIGACCFLNASGNQVATNSSNAGTTALAGFVLRNQGLAPMGWSDSQAGYGFVAPDGTQVSVAIGGDFYAVITGVQADGAANHVPLVGELIWINTTTGALASAPSSVTTVTGYIQASGWKVSKVGLLTPATVSTNQSFCVFSGLL